jgi:membrane-associated phospholipid phosphatase
LDVDRDAVGQISTDANAASNWWRNASAAYPLALAVVTAPSGARLRVAGSRSLLYGEALLLAGGITSFTKIAVSRPRPFTYVPESARPDHEKYDVTDERTFLSMPSGHATTSWCASSFAITDLLLSHPSATWWQRAAAGFTGGTLATTTAQLRVEAGQHFPTDILAGSAIGAACGVGVPLLHRWLARGERAPWPSGHAWLHAGAGTVLGIGTGLLLAESFEH